jgi:hypothetical protein
MRSLLLGTSFVLSFVLGGAAQAVPVGGLPDQVCSGPAGDSNPNCRVNGDAAVPEPGAAGAFALGAALVALRQRRAR